MGKRHTSGQATRALDVDDVLSGRVKPSLDALLDLIHRINPTGHDRRAHEEQARYTLKSRLQSLLVARFADDLGVERHPSNEEVVSIGRRGRVREGCHAVIATLEDHARSWVTFQLDVEHGDAQATRTAPRGAATPPSPRDTRASFSGAAPPRPDIPSGGKSSLGRVPEAESSASSNTGSASTADLLRRAQQALEEYDYAQARADLEEALQASGGAVEPAAALLSLLVDTLGADTDALALEGSLSEATRGDRATRGTLALAAARTGALDRALALVRGAPAGRSAEVFSVLAEAALRAGELARAAEHLAEAKRCDPTLPILASLGDGLARARATARAPAETDLVRLFEAGHTGEAESAARRILAEWPDSGPARHVLQEIETRRRQEEGRKKAAEAEAAISRGELSPALELLGHALVALAGTAEAAAIEGRRAAVEALRREQRAEAATSEVCRKLDGADRLTALSAYLHLDAASRERVRAQRPLRELRWLEETTGRERARVEAVVSLAHARDLLETDPDRALELLGPHREALDAVPEGRRAAKEAGARSRAAKATHARKQVTAAQIAFESGNFLEVPQHLTDPVLRDLPVEEKAAALALRDRAATAADRQHRIDSVARLRAAGRLFEARTGAEALAASGPEDTRARWVAERDALTEQIQHELRVTVDETPCAVSAFGVPGILRAREHVQTWLTRDGKTLVLAEAHQRLLVVRLLDIDEQVVRTTVSLRTPEEMGSLTTVVAGDLLWLIGDGGTVLRLRMTDWHVLSFHTGADVGLGALVLEMATVGTRDGDRNHLWLMLRERHFVERVRVIDVDRGRVLRDGMAVHNMVPLPGLSDPRVACFTDRAVVLCNGKGAPVAGERHSCEGRVIGACAHPSGKGLVVLTERLDADDAVTLRTREIPFDGGHGPTSMNIEGSDGEAPTTIGSGRTAGIVAVLYRADDRGHLLALAASKGPLAPIYDVPAPHGVVLVGDEDGLHLCAVAEATEGMSVVRLGTSPAVLPEGPGRAVLAIPRIFDFHACARPEGRRWRRIQGLMQSSDHLTAPQVASWLHDYRQISGDEMPALLDAFIALDQGRNMAYAENDKYFDWLLSEHPDHPEVRLYHATHLASNGQWDDALQQVTDVDVAALDATLRRHFHHLTAFVAAHAGSSQVAREALARADLEEGPCELTLLGEIVEATEQAPPDGLPPEVELAHLVHLADARLRSGDRAGVLELLETTRVHGYREVQSLARIAEAHLLGAPRDGFEHLRKVAALGRFLEAHCYTIWSSRIDLPLGDARWTTPRLDELASRARAYLET